MKGKLEKINILDVSERPLNTLSVVDVTPPEKAQIQRNSLVQRIKRVMSGVMEWTRQRIRDNNPYVRKIINMGPAMNIKTLGIDLGKNVFHLHDDDDRGKIVLRKKVS